MPSDIPPAVIASESRWPAEAREARVTGVTAGSQALRGRNIGILCNDPRRAEALLMQEAATGVGARVALVRSDLDAASGPAQLEHTARVLGRLYDAVVCIDLPITLVRLLRDAAGIPVIADDLGDWSTLWASAADAVEGVRGMLLARLAGL